MDKKIQGDQVVGEIRKAHEEEKTVEVIINKRTKLFFSSFTDHVPDSDEDDDKPAKPSSYTPFSYLKKKDHLVISPLYPEEGVDEIKESDHVLLRFFDGVKALEADVKFVDLDKINGEPVIVLSFPKELKVFQKRRHFRAKLIPELDLKLLNPFDARVIDISEGGLAFCYPKGMDEYAPGSIIKMKMQVPSSLLGDEDYMEFNSGLKMERPPISFVEIKGIIRNYANIDPGKGSKENICRGSTKRCGVQFTVKSAQVSLQLSEVVAQVERLFLQHVSSKRVDAKKSAKSSKKWGGIRKRKFWKKIFN